MTPLRKTKSTLLTMGETEKAAGLIKVLGASRGYTRYSDLHTALAANGYPASYATFARLMNAARPAQAAEVETIARFFSVHPSDLTGAVANPMKDPAPPRLIEYDLPAPELPEGPKPQPKPARPLPTIHGPRGTAPAPDLAAQVQALADAITDLCAAIRETGGQRAPLRDVS